MSFTTRPNHSKAAINQAGRTLVANKDEIEGYQIELAIVNQWRTCHAYPLNTFKATLRHKVKKTKGALVAQRLKRLPTIIDKLSRYPTMNLAQMQDIGGIRAVLPTLRQVYHIYDEYKQSGRFTHQLIRENDYIVQPKIDGYRGIHLVYRYNNTLARNGQAISYKGLAIELQLRTQLQHTWATAIETVGTLKGQSFKTGHGGRHWREFFELVSSSFALAEGTSQLPQHAKMTPREIYRGVKDKEEALSLLDNIARLTAAVNILDKSSLGGYYTLLDLDIRSQTARVYSFAKNKLTEATAKYAELERLQRPGTDLVLVSAGDLRSLKAAYPNYFLDMREFIRLIRIIIEEA